MFGQTWSHDTIRKYVVLFGTLFDSLYINRKNSSGAVVQTLKVPLSYGPKDKLIAAADSDANLDIPIALSEPRMAFEWTGMQYAAERKLNTLNKIHKVSATDDNATKYQYGPVPYDFLFNLYIMVKNEQDGTNIVEQILPFFTPDWTATINLVPDLNGKYDIPIIFNDISKEDQYEGSFTQRRSIMYTLGFVMKGYLFGPIRSAGVIKEVDVDIRIARTDVNGYVIANTALGSSATITVTPGLTANGQPTSNAAASVGKDNITKDDNYGFIIDFEESY